MDFDLPIDSANLNGKSITMQEPITIEDCDAHLRATALNGQQEIVLVTVVSGYLEFEGTQYAELNVRENIITFRDTYTGLEFQEFVWV